MAETKTKRPTLPFDPFAMARSAGDLAWGLAAKPAELLEVQLAATRQWGEFWTTDYFNGGADKESFNVTPPSNQDDAGKPFRGNVAGVLQALGGYAAATSRQAVPSISFAKTPSSSGRGTRICSIESRSRIVTRWSPVSPFSASPTVLTSTVTQ